MTRDQKIDYLEFPAQDFNAVQNFYQSAFNWIFTDYGTDYRAFNDGILNGGFYKSELKSSTANGAALIVLFAKNLERTKQSIVDAKGLIVKDIFSFPGGRRFHFTDPHGNELAVWSDR